MQIEIDHTTQMYEGTGATLKEACQDAASERKMAQAIWNKAKRILDNADLSQQSASPEWQVIVSLRIVQRREH